MAVMLNAAPFYPLVPAIVESENSKKLFLREQKVREILELWKRVDIALMSIGILSAETGFYYSFPDPRKEAESVRKMGAVGDLLGTPFDIDGKILKPEFMKRTILIDFKDLNRISVVAGIAGGSKKIRAILGALRSGYLNTLITDENTAKKVLSLHRENET